VRKGTDIPYIAHLLAVSAIVLENGGDEVEAVAALLHDVVEDGGGERALREIDERFGAQVAAIVEGCSDTTAAVKEDWMLRKERYLAHLESAASRVLLVSAADKLHNARSILSDLREHGDAVWTRFNRGGREQLWYYGSLRDAFLQRMPGALADELDRRVRDINRLVGVDDRVDWLGRPFELFQIDDGGDSALRAGGFVDWPGCPLIVETVASGVTVKAHVGSGGDYCPDVDEDLHLLITTELEGLRLEYVEPAEVAWLIADDHGDLREACGRVAALAGPVSDDLRDRLYLDPPVTDFAERVERGL